MEDCEELQEIGIFLGIPADDLECCLIDECETGTAVPIPADMRRRLEVGGGEIFENIGGAIALASGEETALMDLVLEVTPLVPACDGVNGYICYLGILISPTLGVCIIILSDPQTSVRICATRSDITLELTTGEAYNFACDQV